MNICICLQMQVSPGLYLGEDYQSSPPIYKLADTIGTLGLSLLVLYINVFLYKALTAFRTSRIEFITGITGAVLLFVIPLVYGYYTLNNFRLSDRKVTVGIIQPNLDPWDKWAGGNLSDITQLHLDLSKEAIDQGAQILVWPETALPVYLYGGSYENIVEQIDNFYPVKNIYLLTGMPHVIFFREGDSIPPHAKYSDKSGYYYRTYNAILLIAPGEGVIQQYGKMKLVPFGERVPFVDTFPVLGDLIKWGVGLSGWNVGSDTTIFQAAYKDSEDSLRINGL
jgi:apolipoprotein N-acyltransferase